METRTILIANTKTQKRYSIQTSATTLGELQDQLDAQGIDYNGMSFTEGITKTQLADRSTVLPTNVMYKGAPTNNLVMLLTNTNKQIASGACGTRKEAYAILKANPVIANDIKEELGRNYTQVSTDTLWEYIEDFDIVPGDPEEEKVKMKEASVKDTAVEEETKPADSPAGILAVSVIGYLVCNNQLSIADLEALKKNIDTFLESLKKKAVTFSDEDIDDMINNL